MLALVASHRQITATIGIPAVDASTGVGLLLVLAGGAIGLHAALSVNEGKARTLVALQLGVVGGLLAFVTWLADARVPVDVGVL